MNTYTTLDLRGSQNNPARPYRMKCDFCDRPSDRLWCYRTRGFCCSMSGTPVTAFESADGAWYACVYCNKLVDARNAEALWARVSIVSPAAAEGVRRGMPTYVYIYRCVFASIYEDAPVLMWRENDLWPVRWPLIPKL